VHPVKSSAADEVTLFERDFIHSTLGISSAPGPS
jgi:hypothetical protein